jgi:hypothetical protein
MSEKTTWLTEVHEAGHDLDDITNELRSLSTAFYVTGNETMSHRLSGLATEIYLARDKTSKAVGKMLSDQVQAGFDQLGSVFLAALDSAKEDE